MPIRSIGISLSNTSIQEEKQMNLFEDIDQRERAYALSKTIDDILLRYGKNSVYVRLVTFLIQQLVIEMDL